MKAVYIHIPFCSSICSYCDFCKVLYQKQWIKPYLSNLEQEIKNQYQGELVKTLYIGGGTPTSLNLTELKQLLNITKLFNLTKLEEFTVECNVENLTVPKLKLMKQFGVNRLSIGVQTFNQKHLTFLNRHHQLKQVQTIIKKARFLGFNNINIDLMFGFPKQTLRGLKFDLKQALKLKTEHLSIYSLIIENNTLLRINKVPSINEDLNAKMYYYINKILNKHDYLHYEISNYAKPGYQSNHNLIYWQNEEYYGFGLGAVSYLNKVRYENTRSITNYLKGQYLKQKTNITKKEMMENEMILGLRQLTGVNILKFKQKYKTDIKKVFPITKLLKEKLLIEENNYLFIPESKIFIANEILLNFID
ncbi:MAG: radical SAM family heme chaperone HemW [Bacilli bacterium]|nr:radical SAM family heme chaperone HemW [Bacilli bacterium]